MEPLDEEWLNLRIDGVERRLDTVMFSWTILNGENAGKTFKSGFPGDSNGIQSLCFALFGDSDHGDVYEFKDRTVRGLVRMSARGVLVVLRFKPFEEPEIKKPHEFSPIQAQVFALALSVLTRETGIIIEGTDDTCIELIHKRRFGGLQFVWDENERIYKLYDEDDWD